ncbi:MAG TPA: hypothetical protein DCR14_09405 [Acidimicrobiaceae bacterium]|nr:hypothetical protein [Acidimicrobiaceae bacterium]
MKKLMIAATAGLALFAAACSNDESDFKDNAEKFIESTEVESQLGTTFTGTSCTEPAKIEAGQTFTCTATAADGVTWNFTAQVTGDSSYLITDAQPAG